MGDVVTFDKNQMRPISEFEARYIRKHLGADMVELLFEVHKDFHVAEMVAAHRRAWEGSEDFG